MRYFLHIGYKGTNYRGWQRQPDVISVQEVLESALSRVLKEPITCIGCGRTDAMVHASQYFFHIDTSNDGPLDSLFIINKVLPNDIAIFDIIPVQENQHAQFDAIERTYDYFIHTYKDPFLDDISSMYLEKNLQLDKMNEALKILPQYNNYKAFCLTPDKHSTLICNITNAQLFADSKGDKLRLQISSNRFLKSMIRILVARLIDIGKGELSVDEFENYLVSLQPPQFMKVAYPQGLFLSKVKYPFLDMPTRSEFSSIFQNREKGDWAVIG